MHRVHVIGNRAMDDVLAAIERHGFEARLLTPTEPTTSATAAAIRTAVLDDASTRVIVVGGDGMVHAGVNALAPLADEHDVSLGVIAVGTGNDFARATRLPVDDLDAAVAVALGPASACDLLRCDHGWIATVATCGFPARVNERANRMRWPKGSSRYTVATLLLVPGLDTDTVTMRCDEGPARTEAITILAVANTGWFGGGMHIVPPARPDDGIAHVLTTGPLGRLRLLRYLPTVFSGRHVDHPSTSIVPAMRVRIEGPADVVLWGDGEPMGRLPVDLVVAPAALRIAVGPPPATGAVG